MKTQTTKLVAANEKVQNQRKAMAAKVAARTKADEIIAAAAELKKSKTNKDDGKVLRPRFPKRERQPLPKMYYEERSGKYFVGVNEQFVNENQQNLTTRLVNLGYSKNPERGFASEIDEKLIEVRDNWSISYAGPLAGHPVGFYPHAGSNILVTKAPPITQATYGGCTLVKDYIERLLDQDQANRLHAWIKLSRVALLAGRFDKFMALVIAGPRDCGKSRLVMLIQLMFNNTVADPYVNMSGGSGFNQDLFNAILLWIDDHGNNPRIESRRNLGNAFKQLTVGGVSRCEGKHRDALTLNPFWRLIVTINDSIKCLQMMPEMDQELLDKLIMLKTVRRAVNVPTKTDEQRDAFWKPLVAGVPDYLGWLEKWAVPERYLHDRFGLAAWQHPDLVKGVQALSNETKILDLIDASATAIFGNDLNSPEAKSFKGGIKITTRELFKFLRDDSIVADWQLRDDANRLIQSAASLGMYLHQLAGSHPHRVVKTTQRVAGGGPQFWMLKSA